MANILAITIADAVEAQVGAKFFVHGGGLRGVSVQGLPFLMARLSVLVAVEIAGDDTKVPVKVRVLDPLGHVLAEAEMLITRHNGHEADEVWVGLNLPPVTFNVGGQHEVVVSAGESSRTRPLDIRPAISGGLMVTPGQSVN